ncbi:unnamed protein product, partial [Larinioides sclopetarius]
HDLKVEGTLEGVRRRAEGARPADWRALPAGRERAGGGVPAARHRPPQVAGGGALRMGDHRLPALHHPRQRTQALPAALRIR